MAKRSDSGLPDIIEAGLQLFEGLARERVSFLWVETTADRGCQFCGLATKMRLQSKTNDGEVTVQIICPGCRAAIIDAPVA